MFDLSGYQGVISNYPQGPPSFLPLVNQGQSSVILIGNQAHTMQSPIIALTA